VLFPFDLFDDKKKIMIRNTPRRLPLYAQIKSDLIRRIGEGEWISCQALPSEWELAEQLGVSQGTVRKAMTELVAQGVLIRRQGLGTFVAEVVGDWGEGCLLSPGLFSETPDVLALELLGCVQGHASEDVSHALKIRRGAPLIQVRQIWRLRGQVVASDLAQLPAESFPDLGGRTLQQCGGSVYVALQRHFAVRPRVIAEQQRAVLLQKDEASMLGVEPEAVALSLLRVSASMEGVPLEWRQRLCVSSNLAYTIHRDI
jgi:GntR family transcriptional regulator